jgi:uncharacterized protein (TIGR02246 family)
MVASAGGVMVREPGVRRRRARSVLLVLASSIVASACAHGAGARGAAEAEARAAIADGNAEFARALVAGDARAMAAVFAEDGEVIPSLQRGFVSGRAEIEAYNARRLGARRYLDVVLTTVHLGVSGDVAWETGTSRVTLQQGEGAPVTLTGRYLAVWKREADGRWRIRADLPIPDPAP